MRLRDLLTNTPIAKKKSGFLSVVSTGESLPSTGRTPAGSLPPLQWIVVRPRFLDNEQVVVVFHKRFVHQAQREYPDLVIYFIDEIEELLPLNYDDDAKRMIHKLKKGLKGWIIPKRNWRRYL